MQTHQIKVINNNDFVISDLYDGIAYHFKPETPKGINMPLDAANHIFGVEFPSDKDVCASAEFREEIWQNVIRRWGWNSHDLAKVAENRKKFEKMEFKPVIFTITEVISGGEDEVPEPREQKEMQKQKKGGVFKPKDDAEVA